MISRVIGRAFCSTYQSAFGRSISQPLKYWQEQAHTVKWETFPKTMLKVDDLHFYKWYPDGRMNISQQCLDVHLGDRGDQVIYWHQSPVTGQRSSITYKEFHRRCEAMAGALKSQFKVVPGDKIIIYMPMTIESLIAIHACARIGATHVIVFGGFAAHELANRIDDCKPKLVICANAGKEPARIIDYKGIVLDALKMVGQQELPRIIYHRDNLVKRAEIGKNQYDFHEVEGAGYRSSPVIVGANHPLYVLYTSGTTGKPKGIVRDHGGTAVQLKHAMRAVFNGKPGDRMFSPSDIGWVVGHSFITYSPPINGMSSVLFEGKPVGTPSPDVYWEVIDRLKINYLYTAPTAIRTIRKEDSDGRYIKKHDISSLRSVAVVGQRCDVHTFEWMREHFKGKLINDNYWQTQTGAPILTNFMGWEPFAQRPGSAGKPFPGCDVKVIDSTTGQQCKPGQIGTFYIKHPLPPSFMLTILNNDDKYVQKYFSTHPYHYNTGDSGYRDEDNYFYLMSREDDVINTAGHRMSTGEMEQILMKHSKIAEAIVIGAVDDIKGEIPTAFVTIKTDELENYSEKEVQKEAVALIREFIGPVASFKDCYVVKRLPKTRSGKYLRKIVRKMFNKQEYEIPSTIEDFDLLPELEKTMEEIHAKRGY